LGTASPLKLLWKSPKPEQLEVTVPLKEATPGPVTLQIYQFGQEKPDLIALKAYAESAALDRFTLSVGDSEATLKGTRLDTVAKATLEGITWSPTTLNRVQDFDQLTMTASGSTSSLETTKHYTATVQLQDGRTLKVKVSLDPPRPQVTLLNKGTQDDNTASPVHLGSSDDLAVDKRLVFFLKSVVPNNFPRDQKVEVAAADGSFHTFLSLGDGSLILEDNKTAMGALEPLSRFGASAFGPIRLRAISAQGIAGDWLPLGTLVRLPGFKELRCPHAAKPCTLTGTNLFLIASVAATQQFNDATDVPPEFTGTQLTVPHPINGQLYMELRDDPTVLQTLTLPLTGATAPAAAPVTPPAARQEPAKPEPIKSEPVKSEPANPEPVKSDTDKAEAAKPEAAKTNP
jgi:hypothetical protein